MHITWCPTPCISTLSLFPCLSCRKHRAALDPPARSTSRWATSFPCALPCGHSQDGLTTVLTHAESAPANSASAPWGLRCRRSASVRPCDDPLYTWPPPPPPTAALTARFAHIGPCRSRTDGAKQRPHEGQTCNRSRGRVRHSSDASEGGVRDASASESTEVHSVFGTRPCTRGGFMAHTTRSKSSAISRLPVSACARRGPAVGSSPLNLSNSA